MRLQSPGALFLQWFALLGAPLAWTCQLVVAYGVSDAACNPGGAPREASADAWQVVLTAAAAAVSLAALASALALYFATRRANHEDAPPAGRLNFFAIASIVVGVIFLVLILLGGVGAAFLPPCRQS